MKRDPITTLLLSIFTCGLYQYYLIYQLSYEIDELCNERMNQPGLELLLTILTCGLYSVYWFYKVGRQIEILQGNRGLRTNSVALINPILAAFGFGFVAFTILVSEINRSIDGKGY